MNIAIQTIPHDEQRYDTVGNWFWEGDDLIIYVSDTGNWINIEFLINNFSY